MPCVRGRLEQAALRGEVAEEERAMRRRYAALEAELRAQVAAERERVSGEAAELAALRSAVTLAADPEEVGFKFGRSVDRTRVASVRCLVGCFYLHVRERVDWVNATCLRRGGARARRCGVSTDMQSEM